MIDASFSLHSASHHLSLHPFFHPPHQSQTGDVLLTSICSLQHCLSYLLPYSLDSSFASSLPSNSLALPFCLPSETSLFCPSNKTKQTKNPRLSHSISKLSCSSPSLSAKLLVSTHCFYSCMIHSLQSISTPKVPVSLHSRDVHLISASFPPLTIPLRSSQTL